MSNALQGFMKGFFTERTSMIKEEQKRRDALAEKMMDLHRKGVESRLDEWKKKEGMYKEVQSKLSQNDIQGAWAVYAQAHDLKKRYDAAGIDFVWDDDKDTKGYLQQEIRRFNSTPAPELTMSGIEQIQSDRAVDSFALERFLRKSFGLTNKEMVHTPYRGLKKQKATPVPYGQESAPSLALMDKSEFDASSTGKSILPPISEKGKTKTAQGEFTDKEGNRIPVVSSFKLGDTGEIEILDVEEIRPASGARLRELPREALYRAYAEFNKQVGDYYTLSTKEDKAFAKLLELGVGTELGRGEEKDQKRGPIYPWFEEQLLEEYKKPNPDLAGAVDRAVTELKHMHTLGMVKERGGSWMDNVPHEAVIDWDWWKELGPNNDASWNLLMDRFTELNNSGEVPYDFLVKMLNKLKERREK